MTAFDGPNTQEQPTGVRIPPETAAASWKRLAEDRLAAVEMWKDRARGFEEALEHIAGLEPGSRSAYGKFSQAVSTAKRALGRKD